MTQRTTSSTGKKLLEAIGQIDRPGAYVASGTAPMVLPGLEVEGLGAIGLPLSKAQVENLKSKCEQAGYGKGEKTLVDTNVRRVWKLSASKFSLTNPQWPKVLDEIVSKVRDKLGLETQALTPHLYDLLLYEKGSFFVAHQDGERIDRMVATLIIYLPGTYTGGELVVRNEGDERVVDFSGEAGKFAMHYAAFYADCQHEVRPVTSGYRLCLVYNLTLAKSKTAVGAPKSGEHVSRIAEILREWGERSDEPEKLMVTLTHQYTQNGLRWDALKGVDRARATALAEAARQSGCHAYLALLTLWESGSVAYDGGYGYGRYGRHEEPDPDDCEIEEMLDSSLTADNWQEPGGRPVPFPTLNVDPTEIVPPDSLRATDPEQDVEGYTGNAGLTMDRWYRHAVIALWPERRYFDILCGNDSPSALPVLIGMVSGLKPGDGEERPSQRQQCLGLARKILANWPKREYGERFSSHTEAVANDPLKAVARLDDSELLQMYLRKVLARDVTLEPSNALPKALSRHGWKSFLRDLTAVFKASTSASIGRDVRLLKVLSNAASLAKSSEREEALATCRPLSELAVTALIRLDAAKPADDYWGVSIDRAKLLPALVQSLLILGQEDLLAQSLDHVTDAAEQYPLHAVQLPAIAELHSWMRKNPVSISPAVIKWAGRCIAELEALTATEPQPPVDQRREALIRCTCKLCKQVNQFLSDPGAAEQRFQLVQGDRSHIENNIRNSECDLACTTDKRPRPQVLICTKTTASFEKRRRTYDDNLKHLAFLRRVREQCRELAGRD